MTRRRIKHRLECGQQCHERGDTFFPAQPFDSPVQFGRQPEVVRRLFEGSRLGQETISRQIQLGQISTELILPVAQLLPNGAGQGPLPLPDREIAVLYRQLQKRRGPSLGEGLVQRAQLVTKDARRESIEHQVMNGDNDEMVLLRQPKDREAYERSAPQIERTTRLLCDEPVELPLAA